MESTRDIKIEGLSVELETHGMLEERIEKLEEPRFRSGYLISKFGK